MSSIQLFQNTNYGGRSESFTGPISNLGIYDFNDRTSSCKISDGIWMLYEDYNFQGDCSILAPGSYSDSSAMKFSNDSLSSLRPYPEGPGPLILLFEDTNYRGRMVPLTANDSNLGEIGFNDKTSSIIVVQGTWNLFQNYDFGGQQWELGPGAYPEATYFKNDSISSVSVA